MKIKNNKTIRRAVRFDPITNNFINQIIKTREIQDFSKYINYLVSEDIRKFYNK